MPYRPEHRGKTRAQIVQSAQELFNRHGFNAVSIDEIMERAGHTRGGFYTYFRGKSDLYAEAVAHALSVTPWSRWELMHDALAAPEAARQVLDPLRSREQLADVEGRLPA